jgi:hypothetical protein
VALIRGVHRFFARIQDDQPEIELFSKLGFQRYARELTYWLSTPQEGLQALAGRCQPRVPATPHDQEHLELSGVTTPADTLPGGGMPDLPAGTVVPDVPLRRWHQHDVWGLLRLYDASTPRRVQMAESLTSNELLYTLSGSGRSWSLPLVEPASIAFVHDRGVRLGGWVRLRFGRGGGPHQLWIMAHPDEPDIPQALVKFGLRVLAKEGARPVACQVREYDASVANALCAAGFTHNRTHALLVRHLTVRALRKREVLAVEPRVVYGVEGLRNTPTHLSEGELTHYATRDLR